MRLYFGGAEINTHRSLLNECGVSNVAMSYMGLRRRVKFSKPWLIKDKFDGGFTSIFLDSGAYTINADQEIDKGEIEDIYSHYQDFVNANLDAVDLVSEFDSMEMGLDWIEEQRDSFWSSIPPEKFMPIWHPVWGVPYLHEMATRYEVIGIPATSLEGRNLRPILNAIAVRGTRIHGVAMTAMEEMQSIRWDSVASTSWVSPQRFGDTIVWTGNQLKRYPKKMKEVARKRHRTLFNKMGLNAEAIANDDPNEVLRLSIKSWLQFETYVNEHHKSGKVVTPLFSNAEPPKSQTGDEVVETLGETDVEKVATTEVSKYRDPSTVLPVISLLTPETEDEEEAPPVINIRSESARMCNSCFLAEKCPMYEPDSNCAYNIPVTIRTREQRKALHEGLIEMQTQRVLFMRFAEDIEGGYADPNLTKEMNLLQKMLKEYAEMEREGFSITIQGQGSAQAAQSGMFSRLFGKEAGQQVQQIETQRADDIIEAEVLDDE